MIMLKLTKRQYGILLALLGATLYAVNAPFSKIVLDYLPPILTAGFLYLGSGLGMLAIASFRSRHGTDNVEKKLDRKEWPYVLAMIALDIVGPICLMVGLQKTTAANASLLSDFEIVATALLAWLFFRERISKRLWVGIAFVTLSCCVLSCEDMDSLRFSSGSLYVILAAFCWGLDNNCTRRIASKDPMQIVLMKGIFSGVGMLLIGFLIGETIEVIWPIFAAMAIGLVSYGLSVFVDIYAQRSLGAARTSAYYAVAPFIGTGLSLLIFRQTPPHTYWVGLALMAVGAWLCAKDSFDDKINMLNDN